MSDKVLTFYLCDSLLGIDITLIKEVNRNVEFTPVPDAKSHIVGLFNMRGQVVTLFNLAKMMGLPENSQKYSTCIILKAAANDPNQVGVLIDRPGDVVEIEKDSCEVPPANVGVLESEYITSIVKLEKDLLMVIDPQKIFRLD